MTDKLPPEAPEQFADSLRSKLRRERLRPGRWFLAALALIALGAAGLRWGLRPPPPLPPLMLVCFDAVAVDDRAEVVAQVVAPGHPGADLGGLAIHWESTARGKVDKATSKTDAAGFAKYHVDLGNDGEPRLVQASFIDPGGAYRRDDRASAVAARQRPIEVIAIAELVNAPVDWLSGNVNAVQPKNEVPRGLRDTTTVYCAGDVDPATYRAMRMWLARQVAASTLPTGPLLRETVAAASSRLAPDRQR